MNPEGDRSVPPPLLHEAQVAPPTAPPPLELMADGSGASNDEVVWPPPPPSDRWAHRRGEPRLFTLYWIAWLMLNSSLVLIRLGPRGLIDPAVSRPATRSLFMLIGLGATVLWPMFRLSQALPQKRPLAGILIDVAIMYSTAQIVMWPQVLLAYWPTHVVLATSLSLLGWLLVTGAVLSFALEKERRFELAGPDRPIALRRGLWMALCLVVSAGGAILPAIAGWTDIAQRPDPDIWMLGSGITSPFELTRDRFWAGTSARIESAHWKVIWGILCAGGFGVLGALAYQVLLSGKPRSGGIS